MILKGILGALHHHELDGTLCYGIITSTFLHDVCVCEREREREWESESII